MVEAESIRSQKRSIRELMQDVMSRADRRTLLGDRLIDGEGHALSHAQSDHESRPLSRAPHLAVALAQGHSTPTALYLVHCSSRAVVEDLLFERLRASLTPSSPKIGSMVPNAAQSLADLPLWIHKDTDYHTVSILLAAKRLHRLGVQIMVIEQPAPGEGFTTRDIGHLNQAARSATRVYQETGITVLFA